MNDANMLERRSTDLEELHSVVRGLIGRKCWRAAFTYGGELSLHFGRRLGYQNRLMKGKRTGEWRLDTRATPWTLFTPCGSTSSKDRNRDGEKSVEERLRALEGRKVTAFSVSIPDDFLTIAFGNDYLFQVNPNANNAKSHLAYWKLFMPGHKLITFGPGGVWSCKCSDFPSPSSNGRLQTKAKQK